MTTGSLHHLLGVAWTVALTVTAVWAVAPRGIGVRGACAVGTSSTIS